MFRIIITSKQYWYSVLLLGIAFVLVFTFAQHFMDFVRIDLDTFIKVKFSEGRWVRFAISRIVGGLFYGMFMAYFFEMRKQKNKK